MKKFLVLALFIGSSAYAYEGINHFNRKNTEAVCKWQDRCGFKTACEWTCLAVSSAPMNKWWKSAAVQKLGQWCGDLCEKVEECKYGYYCDAY